MMHKNPVRLLVIAPACDGTDVGEAWCAYQWVVGLAKQCELTLLTMKRRGRSWPSTQLPGVEVIEWPDLPVPHRLERFNSMLKPGYPRFYFQSRKWIKAALGRGRHFDVIHQLTPIALRYPSPGAGLGIPLILGPFAGSLDTPEEFLSECKTAPWYTKLRRLDELRLRHDPFLRKSFKSASVVIGVAPYVETMLQHIPIRQFSLMSELGVHDLYQSRPVREKPVGALRMLHVGRAVRTKGLRDAVRALAALRDLPGITLEQAGDGEDLEFCRREAARLGVADRVHFHGRIPRTRVEELYRRADVFIFPSFREPSGSVIFESMRHGLPVITVDRGGPGYVVDQSSGIRVPANSPQQLARDLAGAARRLACDENELHKLSTGARDRIETIGLWSNKIHWLLSLYSDVISRHSPADLEIAA